VALVRVHHLNCGTMRPVAVPGSIVCHVLLIETPGGLVLVDSGFGLADAVSPADRLGPSRFLLRPAFDPAEAAINQVKALGFDPYDVRHVILTHFDADHAGGLADLPWAHVHLTQAENRAATSPPTASERSRYRPAVRAYGPRIVEHTMDRAETWRGFPGASELTEIAPGIVLIALPGHTRGHAAVAVDAGDHWVLHVGDAFYHRSQIGGDGRAPRALTAMESLIAVDRPQVRANHARLTEVWRAGEPDLLLVNAHDRELWERARDLGRESSAR
jgi:glyoxylase-like metal-dependent hydrolase (beta-lactamase superfamily II)